jgi:hypothetical protein
LPVAAMARLKPEALQKIAESEIEFGSVSPVTGTRNTINTGKGIWHCLDTGTPYKVSYAVDRQTKLAYAQWEWTPRIVGSECPSCSREKTRFIKALSDYGVSEDAFDKLDIQKKAETILAVKKAGHLKPVKTASGNEGNIIEEYKKVYAQYGSAFPMEMCLQKLAIRFGENAVGLSGPCEGKPIADCVCKSLKSAGVYSNNLAIKVADAWEDEDGTSCCIEDQVRLGLKIKDATSVCGAFKTLLASPGDIFAEKLAQYMIEEAPALILIHSMAKGMKVAKVAKGRKVTKLLLNSAKNWLRNLMFS